MKRAGITSTAVLTPTESKVLVDGFLSPLFDQLVEDARRISPHYETLWQDVRKLYDAGGKRLRSYMSLLTYEAFSNQPAKNILAAAAAQEFLHLAMLIHDDIIDRDHIRYGVKNITREYIDHYEELIEDVENREHYANSAAILAGDLLISEAYKLTTETNIDPVIILKTQRIFTTMTFKVIAGELLDTEAVFRGNDSADPLLIAEQKTATYSFVGPFTAGATMAGADQAQIDILRDLGQQLGIGYQLRDDILGVFGDSAKTGKSDEGDIKEGKRTMLVEEFKLLATPAQRAEFKTLFGKRDLTEKDIKRAKTLLVESGAKYAVEQRIDAYYAHANLLLNSLTIDKAQKKAFSMLIDLCLKREK